MHTFYLLQTTYFDVTVGYGRTFWFNAL